MDECKPLTEGAARGNVLHARGAGQPRAHAGGGDGDDAVHHGRAMHVLHINPKLKAPGSNRLKPTYDTLLSILLQFCLQIQPAPLHHGGAADGGGYDVSGAGGRGFLSSTFQLNLSRFGYTTACPPV